MTTMSDFNKAYWLERKSTLAIAGIIGLAGVGFVMWMPAHNRGLILGLFLVMALFNSPFTLKTAAGRLWWLAFLTAVGGATCAVLLGIHSPATWLFAILAACGYAVGVCLRYRPRVA